jgi:polar amino acid transport system substrate-binding protein
MRNNRLLSVIVVLVVGAALLSACATPTPEVVREEVPVTVEVTKLVEGTPETVVEEKVVTATPEPEPTKCQPEVSKPPLLFEGKMVIAVNATIPPYQFIDDQGNLQGERIDLGNEILDRLCLEGDWINIQWEAVIPGLQGGRWDLINSGMFFTEERAELMELVPYEVQAIAVNVPKENPEDINAVDDLSGMTVAVEGPGYEENELRRVSEEMEAEDEEPITIRSFATFAEAQQALKAGQVDAVWTVSASAKYYSERGEFDWVPLNVGGTAACLAFKETELAEAVAEVLNEMKADGTYDQIMEEWGGGKIDQWPEWTGEFEVY